MPFLIGAYLIFVLLIAPVTLQIRFEWREQWRWQAFMHVWGLPITFSSHGKKHEARHRPAFRVIWPSLRRLLCKIRWQFVGVKGVIALGRADHTALVWGLSEGFKMALQNWLYLKGVPCYFHLRPDFNAGQTWLEGGCILFTRLGNLLASAWVLSIALWREAAARREDDKIWNTQSGV